jgi:hypothetical protein
MNIWGLLIGILLLNACVQHQARITAPPGDWDGALGLAERADQAAVGSAGSLPQEVHLLAWARDGDGSLRFASGRVTTPLPWWQRFPMDILSDALWPDHLRCSAQSHATAWRPQTRTPAELTRLAKAANAVATGERP